MQCVCVCVSPCQVILLWWRSYIYFIVYLVLTLNETSWALSIIPYLMTQIQMLFFTKWVSLWSFMTLTHLGLCLAYPHLPVYFLVLETLPTEDSVGKYREKPEKQVFHNNPSLFLNLWALQWWQNLSDFTFYQPWNGEDNKFAKLLCSLTTNKSSFWHSSMSPVKSCWM
jgi:hypothetical protein